MRSLEHNNGSQSGFMGKPLFLFGNKGPQFKRLTPFRTSSAFVQDIFRRAGLLSNWQRPQSRAAAMQSDDGLSFVIPTNPLRDVGQRVEQYDVWRNGHFPEIIIFDDSTPANQEKYFPLLDRIKTHNSVYYVGPREKEQLLAYLNGRLRDKRLRKPGRPCLFFVVSGVPRPADLGNRVQGFLCLPRTSGRSG